MPDPQNFSSTDSRFKIFASESEVFEHTAQMITAIVKHALTQRSTCNVIIAAGNSVTKSLGRLTPETLNWQLVNWFLADERCVDKNSNLRNELQIIQVLENTLGKKFGVITSPQAEIQPQEAVAAYASRIKSINMFDFCLLGMGDDGHIASLTPGNSSLYSDDTCLLINDSPNPPHQRITLGMRVLRNTTNRILVTTGGSKNKAFKTIERDSMSPVQIFDPTTIVVDRAAVQ